MPKTQTQYSIEQNKSKASTVSDQILPQKSITAGVNGNANSKAFNASRSPIRWAPRGQVPRSAAPAATALGGFGGTSREEDHLAREPSADVPENDWSLPPIEPSQFADTIMHQLPEDPIVRGRKAPQGQQSPKKKMGHGAEPQSNSVSDKLYAALNAKLSDRFRELRLLPPDDLDTAEVTIHMRGSRPRLQSAEGQASPLTKTQTKEHANYTISVSDTPPPQEDFSHGGVLGTKRSKPAYSAVQQDESTQSQTLHGPATAPAQAAIKDRKTSSRGDKHVQTSKSHEKTGQVERPKTRSQTVAKKRHIAVEIPEASSVATKKKKSG
jgi:hypothetical protein